VHLSSSLEQLEAEPLIREGLSQHLGGITLEPRKLTLPHGARVDIDAASSDDSVLVEIHAHQGRLRGGQFGKVARDALKLITLSRTRPTSKLILAFADEDAAGCVHGRSWLAEAVKAWGIEVVVVPLDQNVRDGLRAAQVRQVMVNPPLNNDAAESATV